MPAKLKIPKPAIRSVITGSSFRIGYVPLIDAAPLIVAESLGLFEKHGVKVRLTPELGWGSIREKVVYGELEAAQAPGALLFSILLGTHARGCPVSTDVVLNLQGNAITLSSRWRQKGVHDAKTFRQAVRSEAPRIPVFAIVSPFSSHHFLLREWLRSAGLDPDRQVRIVVLPPPLVGDHMRDGQIDGFCAGEPWNSEAAMTGDGWVVATSGSLAPRHPEKVLLVRNEILHQQPDGYDALRAAILESCKYCDAPENRESVVNILNESKSFKVDRAVLANSLVGPFETGAGPLTEKGTFISFHKNDANAATRDRAAWCLDSAIDSGALTIDGRARRLCLDAFLDDYDLQQSSSRRNKTAPQPAN